MHDRENEAARIYRFGDFELNARTRQLSRLGQPVAIQPKPLDLLLYLIRHRDRFVPRAELLSEVWQGLHVDGEAIRFTVHAARRAVDDDGTRQAVIRTVPRAGFQLVARVEEVEPRETPGATTGPLPDGAARTAFLGRERLMTDIGALLSAAVGGESRVLLVSGEAGIGKTRVLERLADLAESRGFRVLQGRCIESDGAPAFWPWVQVLRAAVDTDRACVPLGSLGGVPPEVARMIPELRPQAAETQPPPVTDPRTARFLMFDSVTTFLKELAAAAPLVVSIDDLHRADAASAALFLHVARELGQDGPGLVLVGTYREAELRVTPAIAEPVAALATLPLSRQEPLRGLDPEDVGTLVHLLSGHVPSAAVVADLHEKTNGNPFFLNQIVRVLDHENRLPDLATSGRLDLELPRHVQDAIRHQLRLVPEPVGALLELASVIGGDFGVTDLELTLEIERAEILSALGVAVQAGVIAARTGEPDRYRFVHALVRDALYLGLSPDARARHHARIARALEARVPEHPGPECASLAHHYSQSASRDDIARSVRFYELAASWSSTRGAFEDALACLDRALALLADTEPLAEAHRCRLLLQLGDALTNVGIRDRAREVLQTAAEIARRTGLREEAATAALRFAPDLLAIETGVFDPDLVRILEAAIDSLASGPSSLRARLLARLAIAHQWDRDQPDRSSVLCEEASRIAAHVNDPDTREYVHTASSLINFSLLEPERQLGRVSTRSVPLEILQRVMRVTSLLLLAQVHDADIEIARFAGVLQRSRHPQSRWYVDLMRSTRALMDGRHEYPHLASSYLALGEKYGDRNAMQSFAAQSLMRAFDLGHLEAYEDRVKALAQAFPSMVAWRAGLVLVLVELDRFDEARTELYRVIDTNPLDNSKPNEWYGTATGLALASGMLGEAQISASLYTQLAPHANQLVVFGYCSYCMGSTHRLLGVLASGMNQWQLAQSHFEAAKSTNSSIGARACNARVYFEQARMLTAAGLQQEAAHSAHHGEALAAKLRMTRLAAKCRALRN